MEDKIEAGRNNNFNLIRILAASAVLLSHCFALLTGSSSNEPLIDSLGMTPGSIAVDVFFVTSGFLVTGSILSGRGVRDFIIARVFRIYPALLVMVIFSVFILGLFFSSISFQAFLEHGKTHAFVIKNSTLFWGTTGALPGVFDGVPMAGLVNASLWTLPFEVRMYALLLALWIVAVFQRWFNVKVLLTVLAGAIAVCALLLHFMVYLLEDAVDARFRLLFMFFTGAFYYCVKSRVGLGNWAAIGMLGVLIVSTWDKHAFFVVYHLVIAYLVLWAAYYPAAKLQKFSRMGDYSYGIYIYAFPVQQSILVLWPDIQLATYVIVAFFFTLIFEIASWYAVEQPALALSKSLRRKRLIPSWLSAP